MFMSQSTTDRSEAGTGAEPWENAALLIGLLLAHSATCGGVTAPTVDWTLPN